MKSFLVFLSLLILRVEAVAQQDTVLVMNVLEAALMKSRLESLCNILKSSGYAHPESREVVVFPKGDAFHTSGDTLWNMAAKMPTPTTSTDLDSIVLHGGRMYITFIRGKYDYPAHQVVIEWTGAKPKGLPVVVVSIIRRSSPVSRWIKLHKSEKEFSDLLYDVVDRLELAVAKNLR